MADILNKGTLLPEQLVTELYDNVKGRSTLAKLSGQSPIPFNGSKEFVFTMDKDVDIVAESGKKGVGGVSLEPITIAPIKLEYGARFSDEFMYGTEEYKLNVLRAFTEGFAKKVARGFDLAAMHGVNPRTGEASTVVGQNNFDSKVTQKATHADDAEVSIETAIGLIQANDADLTGLALAPALATELSSMKVNGVRQYPELAWGANPGNINGLKTDINRTVSEKNNVLAIAGDFENAFKWGVAKDIAIEIIQYGDPDNSGNDLKGHNQIYMRGEIFLGWGILDPQAFARIVSAETE